MGAAVWFVPLGTGLAGLVVVGVACDHTNGAQTKERNSAKCLIKKANTVEL
jgi:hypothetical protein